MIIYIYIDNLESNHISRYYLIDFPGFSLSNHYQQLIMIQCFTEGGKQQAHRIPVTAASTEDAPRKTSSMRRSQGRMNERKGHAKAHDNHPSVLQLLLFNTMTISIN